MALLSEPDFLLLDEPTNHLDLEMIERLEKELKSSAVTLLMVSHDRYFIESVCTHIFELEQGKLFMYTGGYDAYLDQKAARLEQATKQEHIMKQSVKRELERVRKAPRARGTKSVERTARYYALAQAHHTTKQLLANATQKLDLQATSRKLGNKIFQIHSLSKKFGDKVIFDHFSYDFKSGERVGIIGKNGVGKSTFIKLLLGTESPDSGQIKKGDTLVVGHYQQEDIIFTSDKTVLDIVRDQAEHITIGKTTISAAKLLERFLFTPTQQHTRAHALSGGEKRRLHLLMVLIKSPNFLILDEPTNDLDLMTLHVLEEFLLSYTGCLVIISHDRFFMDRLVDHLLVFEGAGVITDFW
jgi:ATP-binding cassette subfamily F protein uup